MGNRPPRGLAPLWSRGGRRVSAVPGAIVRNVEVLCCPFCGGDLAIARGGAALVAACCGRAYPIENGIGRLFAANEWGGRPDVSGAVKDFYEATPFPNYDGLESRESLIRKCDAVLFSRLLYRQLPPAARVLEAGCGTGQLTNYLATSGERVVFGADFCLASLALAEGFRSRAATENAAFVQMNLFRPAFRKETFDVVVASGVLHHTNDPFLGFRTLLGLLKPGGHVIVGLYNRYGRLPLRLRRLVFRLTGERFAFLDRRLRRGALSDLKRSTWYKDQYRHPHESSHSMDEVLDWFERTGVGFVCSLPAIAADELVPGYLDLLQPASPGTRLGRVRTQLRMMGRMGAEGGFFTMVGRKRGDAAATSAARRSVLGGHQSPSPDAR